MVMKVLTGNLYFIFRFNFIYLYLQFFFFFWNSSLITEHSMALEEYLKQKEYELSKELDLKDFSSSLSENDVLFLSKRVCFFPQLEEIKLSSPFFTCKSVAKLSESLLNLKHLRVKISLFFSFSYFLLFLIFFFFLF